ncbi:hypothetical protein F441_13340 [Phytophthora nicotianae CJ01A1]|uniref:Uncharacterized protein n=1 Tax=Phytophthora nicotianae CJ01A1 TaxID=1317063 RepID=W2WL77_PHYNI|nr:hypothetical protein F441_13340 [Phytophthora nicotianae CJ01A1]
MSAALYPATDALDECRPLCGWLSEQARVRKMVRDLAET